MQSVHEQTIAQQVTIAGKAAVAMERCERIMAAEAMFVDGFAASRFAAANRGADNGNAIKRGGPGSRPRVFGES